MDCAEFVAQRVVRRCPGCGSGREKVPRVGHDIAHRGDQVAPALLRSGRGEPEFVLRLLRGSGDQPFLRHDQGRSTRPAGSTSSGSSRSTGSRPRPAVIAAAVSRQEVSSAMARCGWPVDSDARAASTSATSQGGDPCRPLMNVRVGRKHQPMLPPHACGGSTLSSVPHRVSVPYPKKA